jgi:hypothetical protein
MWVGSYTSPRVHVLLGGPGSVPSSRLSLGSHPCSVIHVLLGLEVQGELPAPSVHRSSWRGEQPVEVELDPVEPFTP